MSTFAYFVSGARPGWSHDKLVSLGLGYALEDKHTARGCDNGPGGQNGIVVCHGTNSDGRLGYFPERQSWRKIPDTDLWCGCDNKEKPTPDDLARVQQITGQWQVLDDGHKWLLPTARRWVEMDDRLLWDYSLPRRLSLNDNGQWVPGEVKPRYERLWAMAMAYEQAAADAAANATGDVVRFEFPELDELAITALQVNYRVGPVECDLLGIYDDAARSRIVAVLLDDDTRNSWIKKKLPELARDGGNS